MTAVERRQKAIREESQMINSRPVATPLAFDYYINMDEDKLYKIGDMVPATGKYLCVPCGYVATFSAGDQFTTCEACYAGTSIGPEGYESEDSEFWQWLP